MNRPQTCEATVVLENEHDAGTTESLIYPESDHPNASDTQEELDAAYRYLFEFNPHPMWISDRETFRFVLVNEAAIAHYGYSRDEFLAMTLLDIRPADEVPLLLEDLRLHKSDKEKRGVWRHQHKNGQILDMEITIRDFHFRGKPVRLAIANDVTEHRRIERALQQSDKEQKQAERTLQHIMEGAHCLLWQAEVEEGVDEPPQWKLTFASEQAAQRFIPIDVPADQEYADAWFLSRPPEDRERTDAYSTQEIRANRSYQQEFRCHSLDGALHWLSENVHVEVIGEGKWRCTGVCTDITERKLAEEATRAMTRGAQCLLWYAFVKEGPDGLQWAVEMADEEAAQQFFPLVQPPGMSYHHAASDARLPEDKVTMRARATAALRGGLHEYTQQFRCRRADGEWRWLSEVVRIEALEPGRWHCVGVCTDITEQKQAEEERDRFFTLSLDLLCVVAPNGHFVRLNPAFETVLGYTREELMARPILDFVHPDDRKATIARIAQVNSGANNLYFENRYCCRDGSYRWFAWTSTVFQGFRYGAAHDITPIKEAEIALRRANEELETRVLDRTTQIMEANAQLLTAKEEADRANHAKSEFLSRMSHELRTPLNAVLGFGQILNAQSLTPLQKESVQYILTGGRHLLALINEILDLARVESGHIELALEPLALSEIVCESCALIRPLAAERAISLDADPVDFGRRYVQADRQRLKQALINLLSNAIKYTQPGGKVRVYGVPRPENRFCIAVEDTGRGITLEEQKRLFQPFERLNASNSGVEGTGLGLVMAQRLVLAMEGALTLESVLGEGTTFFIELPQVPSPRETGERHPLI